MINEKIRTDRRARMDVNAGATVRPLSHHSRDDRHASSVQSMRDALNGDCFDEGIGKNDLLPVHRGRIAFVGGFYIRVQNFAYFRKGLEELQERWSGKLPPAPRVAKVHALPDLLLQTLHHARDAMTRQNRERFFVD